MCCFLRCCSLFTVGMKLKKNNLPVSLLVSSVSSDFASDISVNEFSKTEHFYSESPVCMCIACLKFIQKTINQNNINSIVILTGTTRKYLPSESCSFAGLLVGVLDAAMCDKTL